MVILAQLVMLTIVRHAQLLILAQLVNQPFHCLQTVPHVVAQQDSPYPKDYVMTVQQSNFAKHAAQQMSAKHALAHSS